MEFVSFELAKKLKDLGYNVPFFFFYRTDDRLIHHAVVGLIERGLALEAPEGMYN